MIRPRRDVVILLGFILIEAAAFGLDRAVAHALAHPALWVTRIFAFVTWFGQGGVVLYPCGGMLAAVLCLRPELPSLAKQLDRLIRQLSLIFVTVASAGLVNDMLKIVFGRARPLLWVSGDMSGFDFFRYGAKFASFPSGHTATSVAAAIVFSDLFPRGRFVFATFAILIAASRIILDAHYVSDVIAGAVVGWIVARFILNRAHEGGWIHASCAQDSTRGAVSVSGEIGENHT